MELFNAANMTFIMNGFFKTIEISVLAIIFSLIWAPSWPWSSSTVPASCVPCLG